MGNEKTRNEFELKIIDIDPTAVKKRLKEVGAKKITVHNFKRLVFLVLDDGTKSIWVRVRTDGKTNTLTLKERFGSKISDTNEYETEVKDFEETCRIISKILKNGVYAENKREEYLFEETHITIDYYPVIPPYMEIESTSEKEVERIFKLLKLKGKRFGNVSAREVYKHYGIDYAEVDKKNTEKFMKMLGQKLS